MKLFGICMLLATLALAATLAFQFLEMKAFFIL